MTTLEAEVLGLIQKLPEENLSQVITYIKNLEFSLNRRNDIKERKKAFERLDHLDISVPTDFDYKKELEEMRNEKYGYLN